MADEIKLTINGKEIETSPDNIQLPDGYGIVSPDSDSYVKKEKHESILQDRIHSAKRSSKEEFLSDKEFHQSVLEQYNARLGDNGEIVGVKPDIDLEEAERKITKRVSAKYEGPLEEKEKYINTLHDSLKKSQLVDAVRDKFEDYMLDSLDGEEPLVYLKFKERFQVDESGRAYAVGDDGTTIFTNDGEPMGPEEYFNDPKFEKYMKKERQKGSGFNKGDDGESTGQKTRSEYSAEEKAVLFTKWRKEGKKPLDEWNKIPYK